MGVNDGVESMAISSKTRMSYCVPRQVTAAQAAAVVKKYMNDHPEILHVGASAIVAMAFVSAFPCQQ